MVNWLFEALMRYHRVRPPARREVFARATLNGEEIYAIPAEWKNRIVRFAATTLDVWLQFGETDSVSSTITTVSAYNAGTKVLTPDPATPFPCFANSALEFEVPDNFTHFSVRSTGTTGYWYAHLADNGLKNLRRSA